MSDDLVTIRVKRDDLQRVVALALAAIGQADHGFQYNAYSDPDAIERVRAALEGTT